MGSFLSGVLGTSNNFQARAPKNTYQATGVNLATSPYGQTIQQAQRQAQGQGGPAQDTIGRQNTLNDQLLAASQGQGPNPALEQLRQTTAQNINNAAGQVASARGINPALAARMAVDSGAGMNQQAAGQAATMTAQQQIAARDALSRNLAATGQMQLGQQGAGVGALGTAGGLDLQNTLGVQGMNRETAAQNASLDLGAQQINSGVAAQNAQTSGNIVGGLMNGAGGALGLAYGGEAPAGNENGIDYGLGGAGLGGELHNYLGQLHGTPGLGGNPVAAPEKLAEPLPSADGQAGKQQSGPGMVGSVGKALQGDSMSAYQRATSRGVLGAAYAHGGSIHSTVPAMLSPGERVLPPEVAHAGKGAVREYVSAGAGKVPGKAKVEGDSPKNDFVHARLEPGSVVVPRSVVSTGDPARAASFVSSVLKRSGARYAEGGEVEEPKKPEPRTDEHAQGWSAADKLHSMLPDWLSARAAVQEHNKKNDKALNDSTQDMSKGGMVRHNTARGLGGNETRRRIKKAAGPMPGEE